MYKRSFCPCDDCRYGIEKRDGSGHDSMCKICEFNHLTAITADIPDLEALCNAWRDGRVKIQPKPMFDVGDFVRIIDAMDHRWIGRCGKIVIVSQYENYPISYRLDIGGGDWLQSMLLPKGDSDE